MKIKIEVNKKEYEINGTELKVIKRELRKFFKMIEGVKN